MVTPAIFGILSAFVIATVASKEYRNHSTDKRNRRNELDYRRRMIQKRRRR
jgi:hypothetical protein